MCGEKPASCSNQSGLQRQKTAAAIGSETSQNLIAAAIEKRQKALAGKLEITQEAVLAALANLRAVRS